ncbi:hypothetical protein GRI33_07875 [Brucella sp. BO3]|uniref:hypothetical protein n=1 Tax=Brucella sp. BO3 TaxID=2691913 RepID=UPI0015F5B390|nr:hypothetical protein [Brucella sp. BO3]QMV26838.1 hypothetical protein GRI33_07875 [Brucella sp. BO3]
MGNSASAQAVINGSNKYFDDFFYFLHSGRVPEARDALGIIDLHAFSLDYADAHLAKKIEYSYKLLDFIQRTIERERREPFHWVGPKERAVIQKFRKTFERADALASASQSQNASQSANYQLEESGNFGQSDPSKSGNFGQSAGAKSGNFGRKPEWEFWSGAPTPQPEKDVDLEPVSVCPDKASPLIVIYTPSNPSISHISNPLKTHPSVTSISHTSSILPFPLEASKKSARGVSAFSSRSAGLSHERAQRACVSPNDRPLPANSPKRSKTTQEAIKRLPDPFRRSWKHLDAERHFLTSFHYADHAQQQHGNVYSFRLTFSDSRTASLLKSPQPATRAAKWILPALVEVFGEVLPYAFKFEVSGQGQLHCHGFVIIPAGKANNATKRLIQRALLKASGDATKSSNSESAAFYNGLAYYSYLTKAEKQTRQQLPTGPLTYISDLLKSQVKAFHNERRSRRKPDSFRLGFAEILSFPLAA